MSYSQKIAVLLGVIVPFAWLVTAVVLLWGRGVWASDLALMGIMYAVTVFGITVGFHRCFTHRSFETTGPVRVLLAMAGSMSLQGPVIKWCAIHRRHHQVADRDGDPHSPHLFGHGILGALKGMWHSHIGWFFDGDPPDLARSVNDLVADRGLMFVDRTFWIWVLLGLLIPAAISYALHPTIWGALHGFIWGGLARVHVMHHATSSINSVCHIWGTRPYVSSDHSRNNPIFGIVSFGEGWHNNHHAFPTSARHGLEWWQFDISWVFIRGLELCGLAWGIRLPTHGAMETKRRSDEDDSVLQRNQIDLT